MCPQVCKISKWSIENYKRSWSHKLHTLQCKSCLKCLSSMCCNSVKIDSSSIINLHAHLQYDYNRYARFQKDPMKTVGGVYYTNSIPVKCDERTDRETDGQSGANLNAPWLSSRRHEKAVKRDTFTCWVAWYLSKPRCPSAPLTCLTCKSLTCLSLMILFKGNRESKSWLITSTLLAHPDPFLPLSLPPPHLHCPITHTHTHTHIHTH